MKKLKSNLDEAQEQQLLRIEHNVCQMTLWLLLAALPVQQIVFGIGNFQAILGESVVLLILSVYMVSACVKRGIWDRRLRMSVKTNAIISLITAAVLGVTTSAAMYLSFGHITTWIAVSVPLFTFILTFPALSFTMKKVKQRQLVLEREPEE